MSGKYLTWVVIGMIGWVVFLETMFYYSRFVYKSDNIAQVAALGSAMRYLDRYEKIGSGESFFGKYDLYTNKGGESISVYRK